MRVLRLAIPVLAGASLLLAQGGNSARATYASLQASVAAAYKAKDYAACRDTLLKVDQFTHGGGRVTMNLARVHALLGKPDDAFAFLHRYFDMGLVAGDLHSDPDLASLRTDPRWLKVIAANMRNRRGTATARTIETVDDPNLLAEDIGYDPKSRSYFLTSVREDKIVRITEDGKESVFADFSRDPGWPLFAVVVDARRRILWATAAAMPDFELAPQQDAGRSTLLKVDLDTGTFLRRFDLPQEPGMPRVFGDATLLPDGDVLISDGRSGGIFRFSDGTFTRVDRNEFISPQTPAVTPEGRLAFIADYARGIGRIDLTAKSVTWIAHPPNLALDGIDGLYLRGKTLYAIQNGTNPARVLRLQLNPAMSAIASAEVVEANSFGLGEPTHGVFTDKGFVFIANSGWDQITDNGRPRADVKPTPPTLRLVATQPSSR